MSKIILRENIDKKFGNSVVKISSDKYHLPLEIFGLVKLKDYVQFLESASEEGYFQFSEIGGFQFGPVEGSPFDGIQALPDGEVEVGVGGEVFRVSKKTFLQYCSDFGHKAIEAVVWFKLKELQLVNDEWIEKVILSTKIIDQNIEFCSRSS